MTVKTELSIDLLRKAPVTYMGLLMGAQVAALCEPLAADLAVIGLLTRVPTHVNFQCARPHETLAAYLALEGPFACVAPEMV